MQDERWDIHYEEERMPAGLALCFASSFVFWGLVIAWWLA